MQTKTILFSLVTIVAFLMATQCYMTTIPNQLSIANQQTTQTIQTLRASAYQNSWELFLLMMAISASILICGVVILKKRGA